MRQKNRGVVFSGSVASVTRKTTMPKPKRRAPAKAAVPVQDGPWKGHTLYMTQISVTLPMVINGQSGQYRYAAERTEATEHANRRRVVPSGLYWQAERAA